jgi:hypothetical protein
MAMVPFHSRSDFVYRLVAPIFDGAWWQVLLPSNLFKTPILEVTQLNDLTITVFELA